MRKSPVDREALVLRNRAMAAAFHRPALKHRVRRLLLSGAAKVPFPTQRRQTERERILLIRPDHLGDVLLMTPALRKLRAERPQAELHALVGPWSADVLADNPDIDLVLTLPFPGFARSTTASLSAPYLLAWRAARGLRRIGYSSALVLRPDHWWGALLAQLAGIPRRVGYAVDEVRGFLTEPVPYEQYHAVRQNVRLVDALLERDDAPADAASLPLVFRVEPEDRAWVDGYLSEWQYPLDRPIIALHPGSGTWVKQWREEHWALVGDALSSQLDAIVVFTGTDKELPMILRIIAAMKAPVCVMAGDTHVGSLAALFERARIVLGPDSGPLHLAVGVGTPTVTLFGPADPAEFGPWGPSDRHAILTASIGCRPCRVLDWGSDDPNYHPCVRDLSPAQVLAAARHVMRAAP